MDNLRALAMLVGVVFHASIAYSPLVSEIWMPASASNHVLIDVVAWFLHLFRMPLFFLIAGFFSAHLIQARGTRAFLQNRGKRIVLPLIVFMPLIWISLVASILWAAENVESPPPLLGFVVDLLSSPENRDPPRTAHLWFLYYLIQFYLLYALLTRGKALSGKVFDLFLSVPFVVFGLPLVLAISLFLVPVPHPAPDSLIPELWVFGYYGPFFILGVKLREREAAIDEIQPIMLWLLVGGLVLYAVLFQQFPRTITLEQALEQRNGVSATWPHLGATILEAYISMHMTLVCLAAGKAYLNRVNGPARFIADGSYWIYIVHIPILFWIQFALMNVHWGLWTEFAFSTAATLLVGLASYVLLVRWTPIGWLLNGRRRGLGFTR